ncbi:MAG: T9SS type A sorting domain-containing protein [Saprospiraceae bacterium]|nr:T9SS type A sorting domain-containing protein [Candidatus Vicinibacter proximus]MBL7822610.1 T9SS type A sorting domain-containing protein [Saprospiraceae bacterium]
MSANVFRQIYFIKINKKLKLRKITFSIFSFCHLIAFSQTKSIILGRPTDKTVTASILFDQKVEHYIEYGSIQGQYSMLTPTISNQANSPDEVEIEKLLPDTKYFYRLRYRTTKNTNFEASPEYNFHTQRAPGKSFKFLIEADEHLYDKKGVRSLYKITLENQAKDSADFMLSLGDTFGDDHTPNETTSADMDALHKDYLQYLGNVCHSMPFFFCLGNHEGENGFYLKQNAPNNIAVYGTLWRKFYYPNPYPNNFYSGNINREEHGMDLPENYYAWTWGDALFVVLDVYRDCDVNEKPQKWDWTLGETQYKWLKKTLETSPSKFKFVFAHHTRGQGRGAVTTATGFEWGGYDGNVYKFDTYRPGWELPIHQLMVKNKVNIFFQGHDHLYAKEELDGLIYQEVPMPSDSTYQIGVLANADAYTDITLDGSGHIRVTVNPDCVTVDYVRAYLPKDTVGGKHRNNEVAYTYTVGSCTTGLNDTKKYEPISVYPNPATNKVHILTENKDQQFKIQMLNIYGQLIMSSESNELDVSRIPNGVYLIKIEFENQKIIKKLIVKN